MLITAQYEADLIRRRVSPDTLDGYRRAFKTWPHDTEATKADVLAWLGAHPAWSPTTQRTNAGRIRAAYSLAVDLEQIDRNPFSRIKFPRIDRTPPRIQTIEVLRELESRCRSHQELQWLRMYTYTGLRRSEAIQLTVNDIDGDFFAVSSQVAKGGKPRRVPIHPELKRLLVQHRGSPFLIHGRSGQPIGRGGTHGRLMRLRGTLDVQLHDLRRTFVTNMRRGGAHRDEIEAIVGHSGDGDGGGGAVWSLYSGYDDTDLYAAVLKLPY